MAQETSHAVSPSRRISIHSKSLDVPVAVGTTDPIFEWVVSEAARAALEIKNEGANALDAFQVQGKVHLDGAWLPLFSAAGDFTSPTGLIVDASGDLTTLAAGATGWLVLDVLGFYAIRLLASSAVGVTQLDLFARAV